MDGMSLLLVLIHQYMFGVGPIPAVSCEVLRMASVLSDEAEESKSNCGVALPRAHRQ